MGPLPWKKEAKPQAREGGRGQRSGGCAMVQAYGKKPLAPSAKKGRENPRGARAKTRAKLVQRWKR